MRNSRRLLCLIALSSLGTLGNAQLIFSTGFESPMILGDLNGQEGWMVTPSNASGTIQDFRVNNGTQAVELIDGASFGRAQKNISADLLEPILVASFSMYFDETWGNDIETDRFEAQVRIEGAIPSGTFGIEFGYLIAPPDGYNSVPGGATAYYLEIGSETLSLGSAYHVIDDPVFNAWHTYVMTYDNNLDLVTLFVDGVSTTQVHITDDISSVSGVQLQNQRWGTSPSRNASLYFDDVSVQAVPEPVSLIVVGLGVAAMAWKRRSVK